MQQKVLGRNLFCLHGSLIPYKCKCSKVDWWLYNALVWLWTWIVTWLFFRGTLYRPLSAWISSSPSSLQRISNNNGWMDQTPYDGESKKKDKYKIINADENGLSFKNGPYLLCKSASLFPHLNSPKTYCSLWTIKDIFISILSFWCAHLTLCRVTWHTIPVYSVFGMPDIRENQWQQCQSWFGLSGAASWKKNNNNSKISLTVIQLLPRLVACAGH